MTKPNRFKMPVLVAILFIIFIFSIPVWSAELGGTPISKFDVFDADIREVFRSLAELDELNVLMDPEVKGLVTFKIKAGLTVKDAIELLAQTNGYSCRWLTANRTVLIGNEKTFTNFEAKETRVYQLTYAKPDQIINTLKIMVPTDQIGVDTRTNQLTIRASILTQQNLTEIIKSLDREMAQITIDVRVEEIKKSALDKMGVGWDSEEIKLNSTASSPLNIIANASHILQFYEERSQARLLSNPKISTTDSQEGSVFIGDRFPIITTNTSETSGTTYNIQYIDMGTKLSVTPRINSDNIVTVTVMANVSSLTEYKKAGDNDIPVVRNRDVSSVIRLRDGQTFVLSGLNEINSVDTTDQLKGLGSIPLVGWLFKKRIKSPDENTEVCIFITPKIIHTGVAEASSVTIGTDGKDKSNADTGLSNQTSTSTSETMPSPTPTPSPLPSPSPAPTPATQIQPPVHTGASVDAGQSASTDSSTNTTATKTAASTQSTVQTADSTAATAAPAAEQTQQNQPAGTSDNANNDDAEPKKLVIEPTTTPQAGHSKATANLEITVSLKPGDTLTQVAKKYGVTTAGLLQKNNLHAAADIKPGQQLLISIPSSHLYILKPKETLWRLAMRYGTTVPLLMEINNIKDTSKVEAGQMIILPVAVEKVANKKF